MCGVRLMLYTIVSLALLVGLSMTAKVDDGHHQSVEGKPEAAEEPKDKRFYSWNDNSKRFDAEVKRKFYQWGKRSGDEGGVDDDEEKGDISKRKFYQWAGKRANSNKRRFYAWAGKRSEPITQNDQQDLEKRKFYAWAGKRADDASTDHHPEDMAILKRKFYAWAGKRSEDKTKSQEHEPMEKRKFYAWAGRR